MRKLLYITFALAMIVPSVAIAQEPTLTKEITVETEFVPVEQKASKLNVLPDVQNTTVHKKDLSYSDWNSVVDFPRVINKYEPYGYKTKYPFSTAKGYLDLGVGMQLNAVGSAGYRFIDNEKNTLGAWLQHTSTWLGKNTSPLAIDDPRTQKINDNVLGVYFSHIFPVGILGVDAFYHLDDFNYFGASNEIEVLSAELSNQMVHEAGITATWSNQVAKQKKLSIEAQLNYNYFGNTRNVDVTDKGAQENYLNARAVVEGIFDRFSVGVKAEGDILIYEKCFNTSKSKAWMGMLTASPFVKYKTPKLSLVGGVNVNISTHDGAVFRIAPNLKVDYKLFNGIVIYADVNGGKELHTLSDMHDLCRYYEPNYAIGTSFTPIDAEVGVKIGAFSGFYAKPYFAYGIFRNEVLPYLRETSVGGGVNIIEKQLFTPYVNTQKYDIQGWKAGIQLGYNFNRIVDVKADFQYSPQENNKGYSMGLDRAEIVTNAQLKVTPIKPLSLSVGYEWRAHRRYYNFYGTIGTPAIERWSETRLNDISNLSVQASYQFNKTIGIFVNASNLLNKQWDEFVGIGAQRISVLGGVKLQF